MYRGLCINYNRFPYFTKLPELPRNKGIKKNRTKKGEERGAFFMEQHPSGFWHGGEDY